MATSGSFRSSWRGYTLVTNWDCTQNTTNNFSDINIELYLETQSGYDLYVGSRKHTIKIDGSTHGITTSSINIGGGSRKYLGYISKRVYHNNDGTKSITISSYFDMRANIRGTYQSGFGGSETFELTKIPRMSTISDNMDGSRYLGTQHTIHLDAQLSNVTHTLWYRIYGEKGKSEWQTIVEKTSSKDISFTPTDLYIDLQPNNNTIYMDICCRTYRNGEQLGEDTYNDGWYMKVPTKYVPIIKNISITDTNSKTRALGVYVQNHSKINVKTNAEGIRGSIIKNILVEVDNVKWTGSNITTNEILHYGNINIKVTVKDTRDRTTTQIKTIKVEEYFVPTIKEFSGYRLENDLKTVSLLKNFKTAKLNGKNTIIWETQRKPQGSSNWTTIRRGTDFELNRRDVTINVSEDYEYDMKLVIADFNTTVEKVIRIYTSFSLIDFHKDGRGLAVGRSSTQNNLFDIDLPTKFRKEVEFDKTVKKIVIPAELKNGWYDVLDEKSPLRFFKDLQGVVHIQGRIKGGTAKWGTVIFNLPKGYRPKYLTYGHVSLNNYEIAHVRIETSGDVRCSGGTEEEWTKWACFDGITFFTE